MNDIRSRWSRAAVPLIAAASALLFALVVVGAGETPVKQDPPVPSPGPTPAPGAAPEGSPAPAPGATVCGIFGIQFGAPWE